MTTTDQPVPFWKWKAEQIRKDSESQRPGEYPMYQYMRLRDWYYSAYGTYCAKFREGKHWEPGAPE